jgi:hypothetical protein
MKAEDRSESEMVVVAAAAARYLAVKPLFLVLVHHSRPAPRLPRRTASARPLRFLSCSTSAPPLFAAVAFMDSPPQGYRTNVGICLADPSLTKASAPPPSSTILLLSPTRLLWVLYCWGFVLTVNETILILSRFSRLLGSTFLARGRCLR